MRILVITPQYAPDFGPSAPIFTDLCEDLYKMGHEVTVIAAFPHYGRKIIPEKYKGKIYTENSVNGVRVIRTYVYLPDKNSITRRLIYHLSYNILAAIKVWKLKTYDVVLADAPFLWSGVPLFVARWLNKKPFIYVIHDIYPDVIVRLGMITNKRVIWVLKSIENYFCKKSAYISVLSKGFKDNLIRKGVSGKKIKIIPVCVDGNFIRPLDKRNKFRARYNLLEKFVVMYAGNIGLSQGLELLIQTASLLKYKKEIVFVLVGDGAERLKLEKMTKDLNLKNVIFVDFQDREEVPYVLTAADIHFVSLKKDIVCESVPSKVYSIMASGRPILAVVNEGTETYELIKNASCGWCIPSYSAKDVADLINEQYLNNTPCQMFGDNGRVFALGHFGRDLMAHKYDSLVRSLSKRSLSE